MTLTYLTLKETQNVLLDMLTEMDRVCRENGLHYSLAYGTLLGAIRHKGFIPWDDDVDIVMPRPDYEKLYELVKEGRIVFRKHYSLSEDRGKKGVYPFVKLLDDRYSVKSTTHIEVPNVYLDIFPLDGMPQLPPKEQKKLHRKEVFYKAIVSLDKWYIPNNAWYSHVLRIIGFWFYLLVKCYGRTRALKNLRALLLKYPVPENEFVDDRSWGTAYRPRPRAYYENLIDVQFEGRTFYAISAYDEHLKSCYGDYMTPPPENKRFSAHCMKIYRNKMPD